MSGYELNYISEGEERTMFGCRQCPGLQFTAAERDFHWQQHLQQQQRQKTGIRSVSESAGKDDTEKCFFVDTKNKCFLCLKEFDPSVICSSITKLTSFPLRKIFHYLQLDTAKLFDGVNGASPLLDFSAESLENVSEFSVVLCKDCSATAEKLCGLCEELELLQTQVNHTLRTFHGKLTYCSEMKHLVEVDQVRNKLVSPMGLDLVHAMVADILREKTKEQCCLKLKTAMPTVKMYETPQKKNFVTASSPPPPILSSPGSVVNEEQQTEDEASTMTSDEDDSKLIIELSAADIHQIQSFKPPKMSEIPQKRDNNDSIICTMCPLSVSSEFTRELLFQRHVTCCHLDFLFSSLKLPQYSMEQFKAYCEHLLDQEIKSSELTDMDKKKNSDELPGFSCYICCDIFHEVKVLLGHLVFSHHDILAQKLVVLQKNTTITPEELMSKKRCEIFIREEMKFKCDACGRVFACNSSLYRHKRAPCKPRSETPYHKAARRPFICAHCGLSFTSSYGRTLHTKRVHLGINHNRDRTKCELCGKNMSVSSVGRHKSTSCKYRNAQSTNPSCNPSDYPKQQSPSEVQQSLPYYLNENLEIEVVDEEEEEEGEGEEAINLCNNENEWNSVLRMSNFQTRNRGNDIDEELLEPDDYATDIEMCNQENYQDVEIIALESTEEED